MKLTKSALLGLLLTAFCSLAFIAVEDGFSPLKDVEKVKKNIADQISTTSSIHSDFLQEKHLSFLEQPIVSKGEFYFKKEKKLRWEYIDPFKYLIVLNGDKVIIKDEKKTNQFDVASNKIFKEVSEMLSRLLRGEILNDEKDYEQAYFEGTSEYLVRLSPKKEEVKEMIDVIELYFDKTNHSVVKVNIQEKSGDYTLITFENTVFNEAIADEKFVVQ